MEKLSCLTLITASQQSHVIQVVDSNMYSNIWFYRFRSEIFHGYKNKWEFSPFCSCYCIKSRNSQNLKNISISCADKHLSWRPLKRWIRRFNWQKFKRRSRKTLIKVPRQEPHKHVKWPRQTYKVLLINYYMSNVLHYWGTQQEQGILRKERYHRSWLLMYLKGSWGISKTALSSQESEAEAQTVSDYCRFPLLKTC